MTATHTLTRHKDIQKWAARRRGIPGIRREPDPTGTVHCRLIFSFAGKHPAPATTPTLDDGMSPVSWTAWLAELDRQHLALLVRDESYEFVERKDLN